jgi:hypothetical protein
MKAPHHTSYDGLEIVRLGRAEWRVNDSTESGRLLGYIERQNAGRYEVMWMTDPMRWGYAASFDEALVAFGDSLRFSGEVFDERAESADRASTASRLRRSTWLRTPRLRASRRPDVA